MCRFLLLWFAFWCELGGIFKFAVVVVRFKLQQPDDVESIQDVNDVIMTEVPEISNVEQIPDSQNNQNEHEISQTYEGAPEVVSPIHYKRRLMQFCHF